MNELAIALKIIHDEVKENFRAIMEDVIDLDEYADDDIEDEDIAEMIAEELYHRYEGNIEKAITEARRLGRAVK